MEEIPTTAMLTTEPTYDAYEVRTHSQGTKVFNDGIQIMKAEQERLLKLNQLTKEKGRAILKKSGLTDGKFKRLKEDPKKTIAELTHAKP